MTGLRLVVTFWMSVLIGNHCAGAAVAPEASRMLIQLDDDDQLRAQIALGRISLGGGASLPVQLEHAVKKSISGDLSWFSLTPIQTYVVPDDEMSGARLWRSPLGGSRVIPPTPFGLYSGNEFKVRFQSADTTFILNDGTEVCYTNGLIRMLMLPDGAMLKCTTKGQTITAMSSADRHIIETSVMCDQLTMRVCDGKNESTAFNLRYNGRGQVVQFDGPNCRGSITYDAAGMLSSITTDQEAVALEARPVAFWDYSKRQRGLNVIWRVSARHSS